MNDNDENIKEPLTDEQIEKRANLFTKLIIGILLLASVVVCIKKFGATRDSSTYSMRYEPVSAYTHMLQYENTVAYEYHSYPVDNQGNVSYTCAVCGYTFDPSSGDYYECIPDTSGMGDRRHIQIDYDSTGNELCRFYTDHNFDENGVCKCGATGTPSIAHKMTPPEIQAEFDASKQQYIDQQGVQQEDYNQGTGQ